MKMKNVNIIDEYEKSVDKLVSTGVKLSAAKEMAKKMMKDRYEGDKEEESSKALVDIKDYGELYKTLYKDRGPVEAFDMCSAKIKKEKTGVDLYNEMNKLVDVAKKDYAVIGKPLHWESESKEKGEDGVERYSKVSYTYSETPEWAKLRSCDYDDEFRDCAREVRRIANLLRWF